MRIAVVGASGRMGKALIAAILDTDGATLSGAIEREGAAALGQDAGSLVGQPSMGIALTDDPLPVFAASDAVLDFTAPEATLHYAELAAQARIVHVIGTTGMSEDDDQKLNAAARHAAIIKSGNMSLGVNLLAVLVKQAAKALSADFDIEVLEMHHKAKVDAPSGTALLLGESAADGRGLNLQEDGVFTRHGITGPRPEGAIGFATMRGGSVVGDHSVLFAGPAERITLSHHAEDRSLFARGAVKAALWGYGKKPGRYTMQDVLGLADSN
ncbi:4-hydroxy-tetrahydrodipicolinate reductase [Ahrensia marina]|uniref:4-hydroxy-tetrahydrodipicolinate reductase n=1 Tax=Ahrensia marina TaxID=1514904 RepID=UPI0035D02380